MRRLISSFAAVIVLSGIVALPGSAAWADGTDPTGAVCTQQTIPVTLSATSTTTYNISGRLCLADDALRGAKTIELMVHGLTYDHNYFNFPYQPSTYSWVHAAAAWGYSSFNIDRIGVGNSGHPPADQLTVQSNAYVVGQIVRLLHSGGIGGRTFTTVVGIGHSFGGCIMQYLAGTATDRTTVPDLLVLSAWLTRANTAAVSSIGNTFYDAASDPAFASAGLPTGYQTTIPGTRAASFYNTSSTEADLITLDESLKQTGTLAERTSMYAARGNSTVSLAIGVPVVLSLGQKDRLLCDETVSGLSCADAAAILARESASYSAKACLEAIVVADAGHSVNLHIKARDSYNFAHNWIDKYTVNGVDRKDANGCVAA